MATKQPLLPGEIIGRVELVSGVPVAGELTVVLEGTPLGAKSDETGVFDIKHVPPGRWDLRITAKGFPSKRVPAASNPGEVTDLGVVLLAAPGFVSGRVLNASTEVLANMVIGITDVPAVTKPLTNGGYLLGGAPPGRLEIYLDCVNPTARLMQFADVKASKTTMGVDFDFCPSPRTILRPRPTTTVSRVLRPYVPPPPRPRKPH